MTGACSLAFSFKKTDRLLKRSEFLYLSSHGKKIRNRHFIAIFHKTPRENARIGITVSKRVGNAAKRNRIKRLIREYYRLNREKYTRNLDINIIARKEVADLPNRRVFSSLREIFDRIPTV